MSALLLDANAWAWSLSKVARLSQTARRAMEGASRIFVSAPSFYEIEMKVRLGKWPQFASSSGKLQELSARREGSVADIDGPICALAASCDWAHRDPFDRLIFATAKLRGLSLVSADEAFDAVIARVW